MTQITATLRLSLGWSGQYGLLDYSCKPSPFRAGLLTSQEQLVKLVSIQLTSPASGNTIDNRDQIIASLKSRFHSINVPSEWEHNYAYESGYYDCGFHSINVPSEWELLKEHPVMSRTYSFHSINVPSEWEHNQEYTVLAEGHFVSIQLTSPASGNSN